MRTEPEVKRTIAFIDGQNLYFGAKEAFGHSYPNYDIPRLCRLICERRGWEFVRAQFYTGIPQFRDDEKWFRFWTAKLAVMGTRGVKVFSLPLRYRNQTVRLPDGRAFTFLVGQEKGIDIRIALDVVHAANHNECDVALVFSQDQDLSEVAQEVRDIAQQQDRWFKIASAFPISPTSRNTRGVDKTDWIEIDRTTYEQCLDPMDYFKRPR
jgi:uncharacterized LabA/DUF88 family protein